MTELAAVGGLEVALANALRERIIDAAGNSTFEYSNAYIFTGPSGGGKSTVLQTIGKLLCNINYVEAVTDRRRRPSEHARLQDGQSTRGGHEFLTPEEMDARIAQIKHRGGRAVTWSLEAKGANGITPVFNRYLVDRASIDGCLEDDKDFLIPTPVPKAVTALRKEYPNAHVVYIMTPIPLLYRRMILKQKRSRGDAIQRVQNDTPHLRTYRTYGREFGTIIRTAAPHEVFNGQGEADIIPLDHIASRLSHLILWAREHHPPDMPAVQMHANYAVAVQNALLGDERPLRKGIEVVFPCDTVAEYNESRMRLLEKSPGEKPIPLPDVVKLCVSEFFYDRKGMLSIILRPETGRQEPDLEQMTAIGGLINYSLAQRGFLSANPISTPEDLRQQTFRLTDFRPGGKLWAPSANYGLNINVGW